MNLPTITPQQISDVFTLYHVENLPVPVKFHRFTEPDFLPPHDHPVDFWSTVLYGSYVEMVFTVHQDGEISRIPVHRKAGDRFFIKAEHIHQIIALPDGECWTMTTP